MSNRWDLPVAALLCWHWQKAGTLELVHDVTKNEPGAARPKRLWFALFTLTGRLVSRAGRLGLRVSAAADCLAGLIAARLRLALVAQALPAPHGPRGRRPLSRGPGRRRWSRPTP